MRVPSREEVQGVLDDAANTLTQAAEGKRADDVAPVRRIIELLTGGRLMVYQCGERKTGRGWVKLQFECNPEMLCAASDVEPDGNARPIDIELRTRPQHERIADEVMSMVEQGVTYNAIATRLGCGRNNVTKAVHHWHTVRGLPLPDGRSNKRQPAKPRIAETIVETVMAMIHEMPIKQIAEQLGVGRNKVAEALKLGYERQGLPVPDGRALRKQRNRRRRRRTG